MVNIAVVVVTFNRLEKLKKALRSYSMQEYLMKHIIVVNNNSTDGTKEFLEEWGKNDEGFIKHVLNLSQNVGGAGGFYEGEKFAMSLNDINWVFISDDDAYLSTDYLKGMAQYIENNDSRDISIVCGSVEEFGNYENFHRRKILDVFSCIFKFDHRFYQNIRQKNYKENFYLDIISYVGIMVNKDKFCEVGLTDKDFFIWQDDVEHSLRLRTVGKIICLPMFVVKHDIDKADFSLNWKKYYGIRNLFVIYRRYFKMRLPIAVGIFLIRAFLSPLRGHSLEDIGLRMEALMDGLKGRLGIHPIYKPGWVPKK